MSTLDLLLAIDRAKADGWPFLAEALVAMLRIQMEGDQPIGGRRVSAVCRAGLGVGQPGRAALFPLGGTNCCTKANDREGAGEKIRLPGSPEAVKKTLALPVLISSANQPSKI